MNNAFGIVNPSGNHIWVEGLQQYRSIGAFSFLGRYRVIDFPISNMSNSGINQIQVFLRNKPRSLIEHLGTGRHYNINSKRGKVRVLLSEKSSANDIYNTDIAAFSENLECIERMHYPYVVIAPSYMVYKQDFDALLQTHIDSGADITLLYHSTDNAKETFLNCDTLDLNRQKGVLSIDRNRGTAKNKNIFMDTYVMKKDLLVELVQKAKSLSSMYTLPQIVSSQCSELDVRGIGHRGFFASITDFMSYYNANMSLIDYKVSTSLFDDEWPIYTRTNDSCPTQYFEAADVKTSVVSNGCLIEGTVENSVIGRGCIVQEDAVVKNSILLPGAKIGTGVYIENQVVDKGAKLIHGNKIVAEPDKPGYIRREDTL